MEKSNYQEKGRRQEKEREGKRRNSETKRQRDGCNGPVLWLDGEKGFTNFDYKKKRRKNKKIYNEIEYCNLFSF